MSENLSILDGELRRQFAPVDRLSVDNQGGGVSPWVISDFLDISTLSVSENGLYLAAEEEYDCYEEVEVDISEELGEGDYRRITGKDPNLDPNNDYAVGLDENGNLTKEMIPAAIHIVVKPRKLKYEDGETLDFTGIHVYLMDGNNKRYTDESYPTGEIPFDELMFPVTVADESEASGSSEYDGITISFAEQNDVIVASGQLSERYVASEASSTVYGYGLNMTIYNTLYCGVYVASKDNFRPLFYKNGESPYIIGTNIYRKDNRAVYYIGRLAYQQPTFPIDEQTEPISTVDDMDVGLVAWIVCYGNHKSGGQEIPVQWMRSDGEILEDTFEIEVGESGEPSPPQPDPWAGSADVSWGGHHYNLNRRIVPEVHYANGYLWQEGTSEYTVEQAASMGWLILIR